MLCVSGYIHSLEYIFLLFSWENFSFLQLSQIKWPKNLKAVGHSVQKYITSRGLRTLYDCTETPTQWKSESIRWTYSPGLVLEMLTSKKEKQEVEHKHRIRITGFTTMENAVATTAWCLSCWDPIWKWETTLDQLESFYKYWDGCQYLSGDQNVTLFNLLFSGPVQPVRQKIQHENCFSHWDSAGLEDGNDSLQWIDIQVYLNIDDEDDDASGLLLGRTCWS